MAVAGAALSRGAGRVSRRLDRLSEHRFALLVSIPGLILVALIVLPPTLAVFGMSLFRIELGKDDLVPFVGLNNYLVRLPADDEVLAAIPRTLIFAALSTAITLPLALVTALVLNRGFRGVSIFFMALLLPWAVASIVAGIFWRAIFDTNHGIVNGWLVGFGVLDEPFNWLASTAQTVVIALFAQSWRSVPLLAVLLLAALKTIPPALYRAAKMDGATSWESFRFITLPAIKNTLIVVGVLQVIIGLQVFDLLYSLTSGGPGRDTYVLIMAIYDITFGQISLGYGAAITVILFLIIVAASFLILIARVRRRAPIAVIDDEAEDAAATSRTSLRLDQSAAFAKQRSPEAEDSRRSRIRLPRVVTKVGFAIGVLALFFFYVAPIAWMVIASLQPTQALASIPPNLTLNLWLDGYQTIASDPRWLGSLAVSPQVSILTAIFVIILSAPPAYALARYDITGKGTVLALLILVQMVPAIVMAIPVLRVFQIVGLTDTVASLVIVNVAFWLPLIIWLLRNFFLEVPASLEKAARIDGCSRLGTLFRVTIPAARPGMAAAGILILIGTWNEFLFAVILGNRNAVPITRLITGIQNFPGALNQQPPPNLLAAAAIVAVLPCLLLVVFFNRRIISGLTGGFVKG